jgi:hypothetical protein
MRKGWSTIAVAVCLLVLSTVAAADPENEIDNEFRADIVKLMELTGALEAGEMMATLMADELLSQFEKIHPEVPARAWEIGREVIREEFGVAFQEEDGFLNSMIPLYAKYFTHDEIRGLTRFYETDLGKKTIAVMPALMQEGVELGREWGVEMGPRIERALKARLRAEGVFD